ncbi:right-handed parallel beta-helix repeat-containing protein [uncultured Prevotella sp.]|uniref:right-handed parallel beta-helix repeat-containing protein n=1 Tax=uncultured Prevotella sp. TaxID=159272 RepID=UPI0025879096|nr:right-handed parallel beta-helix repeat-containing protein [uncultured Prevotella sp.]
MIRRIIFFFAILMALVGCEDNDSFTTSTSARLSFSIDSLKMDTVFSTVGSRTYDFWVYNRNSDGVRLQSVRLAQGNQTGFRVNVDGAYLDNSLGSVVTDLEVREGDSIRVFVELTAPENGALEPQLVEDKLVFRLESGVEQQLVLQGHTWDAVEMRNVVVHQDSLIESKKPIIVYGGLKVDSAATLTIRNTTLYFHEGPGLEVYGRLLTDSVVMRGDRLDHMFDYLPYDRVSGQWGKDGGVVFRSSSTRNVLRNTEIRNAGKFGICCDSTAYTENVRRLDMDHCIVHNCKGAGVVSYNANIRLRYCQLSNTQGDCLAVYGGKADVNRCTFAQFYPFVGGRGAALRFSNILPLYGMNCDSSIVTGYDEDVVMGVVVDTLKTYNFQFSNTLLRTPYEEGVDTLLFRNVKWESPKDSIQGKKHFKLIDEDNLKYDFHLDSISPVQGWGCY